MNEQAIKTPVHFWIVAVIAVLWDAVGAFDYVATQYQMESYMANFTPEQREYFYGFPAWMDAFWAIGVWGAFVGSIFLLFRKTWAIWMFAASIVGLAVSTVYNFILSDGAAVMGQEAVIFTVVIWAIAIFLLVYSIMMGKKGVLR